MEAMVGDIEDILKEHVLKGPGYAILKTKTTDISNKKQLTFCVKYVNRDSGEICTDNQKEVRLNGGKAEKFSMRLRLSLQT